MSPSHSHPAYVFNPVQDGRILLQTSIATKTSKFRILPYACRPASAGLFFYPQKILSTFFAFSSLQHENSPRHLRLHIWTILDKGRIKQLAHAIVRFPHTMQLKTLLFSCCNLHWPNQPHRVTRFNAAPSLFGSVKHLTSYSSEHKYLGRPRADLCYDSPN